MAQQANLASRPAAGRPESRSWTGVLRTSLRKEKWADLAIGSILPVLVLLGWQLAGDYGLISTFFLPTPRAIAESFGRLAASGELAEHLGVSLGRAAAGFALGGGLGLLCGIVTGTMRRAEHLLDPSFQLLRMIPHLAVAPLFILWFGFGELSKVLIIAKGAFFPLYVHTFLGIRSVDKKLVEVTEVLRFSRSRQIWRLIVPSALPNILLGLRLSLAVSWLGLVVAELIGSQSGIGFLINFARQSSATDIIFVGVILFAVVGKLVDSFVRQLERRLLGWRDSFDG
ncbi:ABC transporter permease [Paenibacillus ginsengarvi]|uniref:ABC transporter permease n=1 Tax=Paenibacillus ginsengarvi TaxID=400777 RepID=A0A3B0BVR0_9BACL|nr:ABC transporter permease [Paenibacillus ginsengarvi]RKN76047.1 ABC transporter permease [Paenibacillus ginsengarvi]